MTGGDLYRVKAAEHHARAATEQNPLVKTDLETLAQGYLRLAEHADRNSTVAQDAAAAIAAAGLEADPAADNTPL
jgi:hypothetical protein